MSELKPCPFCGGEAIIFRTYVKDAEVIENSKFYPIIRCLECLVQTQPYKTEAEAITAWNKRAEQPVICAYCLKEFPRPREEKDRQEITSHYMICEKNPLVLLIAELDAELAKLNIILYHRENGLSHPDLQAEIDKSKFAELEAELAKHCQPIDHNCVPCASMSGACCGVIYWSDDGQFLCNECGRVFDITLPQKGE